MGLVLIRGFILLHFLFLFFLFSLSGRQGKWQSHHTRFNIWRRVMVFFGVIFMGLILWVRYYFLMGAFLMGFGWGQSRAKV